MDLTLIDKGNSYIPNSVASRPMTLTETCETTANKNRGAIWPDHKTGQCLTGDELKLKYAKARNLEMAAGLTSIAAFAGSGAGMFLSKTSVGLAAGASLVTASLVVPMVAAAYPASSNAVTTTGAIAGAGVGLAVGLASRNAALGALVGGVSALGLVGLGHLVRKSQDK